MKFEIIGNSLPAVICKLIKDETVITECGGMAWMSPNMHMETTSKGGISKMFSRFISGESLFLNQYTSLGGDGTITFASSFPGSIIPFEITPQREIIVQKRGFLAAQSSVMLSTFLNKRFRNGIFGGEGFVMQKLSGNGTAFVEIDGSVVKYHLDVGQKIVVSTGYLAAMDATCTMEIVRVSGAKNVFFGGEGLFNTEVMGPGDVYLQTMPISSVAGALAPYNTSADVNVSVGG